MTRLRVEGVPAQVDMESLRPGQVYVVVDVHLGNRSVDLSDEVDAGVDEVPGYHVMGMDGNRGFLADTQIDGTEPDDGILVVHSEGRPHMALARSGEPLEPDEPAPRPKRKYTRRVKQEGPDAPVE